MDEYRPTRRSILNLFLGSAGAALTGFGPSVLGASTPQAPAIPKRGMYVVITGSGSAIPDPQRGNASAAVVVDGVILQFDCGSRMMENLMLAGINPTDISYMFFTHLHHDHVVTYDYFVMTTWIAGRRKPFKVFGPAGTADMSHHALNGKMALHVAYSKKQGRGDPPVDVKDIEPGVIVQESNLKVIAAEVDHWGGGEGTKSFGYRVESPYGSVVITGDTGPSRKVIDLAKGADLLIHECVIPDAGMQIGGDFSKARTDNKVNLDNAGSGHTTPTELGVVAQAAQVKRLVATHLPNYLSVDAAIEMGSKYFGPRQPRGIWTDFTAAVKNNYKGEFILAEDSLVIEIGKP